ncbi:MAG TPA: glycosyltransferase family 2 protein [Chitinophagaceae bacterium]|nr:glycosyltransferase family 2 protein [Chitinophagaceae bacterium]
MKSIKTENPFVSIIILNWNGLNVTCEFLDSMRNSTYKNYEIIVVDNGSAIDPTERIQAGNYYNTKVCRSPVNLGFTGGNNFGMRHASPDYDFIFLINNDAEITPDLIEKLLEPFYEDPAIGVVCPKIRFHHSPAIIQYAGFNKMNMLTGKTTAVGSLEADNGQHDVSGYTHCAHGCAMMVKKEVIEKVGMLAEKFFIYYEESDWSARIIRAGYKIYYQAKGLCFHKESISMGKQSPIKVYFMTRNRILYMRRNATLLQFLVFISFFNFFTVPKTVFKFLLKKQWKHLKAFINGVTWNLTTSKKSTF